MQEIFERLTSIGIELTLKVLKNKYKLRKQNSKKVSFYKRRKPSQSEITISELKNKDSKYLLNKIRMLEDPYPNAFLKTKDGKKIKIKSVELY